MLLFVSVFLSAVRAPADAALIDRLAAPLRAVTALLGETDAKRVTLEREGAGRCCKTPVVKRACACLNAGANDNL